MDRRLRRWAALAASVVVLLSAPGPSVAAGATWGTIAAPAIYQFVIAPDGSLYGTDLWNSRVYHVDRSGAVSVFAGAGAGGFDNGYSGDGGPAIDAHFVGTIGIAWAPDGSLLVVDHLNDVIRRIDGRGIVTTIAGSGPLDTWFRGPWYPHLKGTGDDGPALGGILDAPWGIAVDRTGALFIADRDHDAIRRVAGGIITTVAGTGQRGFGGDGGPATAARLNRPGDLAFPARGGFLVADENNARIRYVDPAGTISTFAGTGKLGCGGDGGRATQASVQNAGEMAIASDGSVAVVNGECHRVRLIRPDGVIVPLVGNGVDGCSGFDGGLGVEASLDAPGGVAYDRDGSLILSDPGCLVVLRLDRGGRLHLVADLHGLGG